MKKRYLVVLGLLASGFVLARSLSKANKLELENRSGRTLDVVIGTESVPDGFEVLDLKPGEKRFFDLTLLPLLSHDAIYIRFPGLGDQASYVRTLIYDIDEQESTTKAAIVDYGQGLLDVKLTR